MDLKKVFVNKKLVIGLIALAVMATGFYFWSGRNGRFVRVGDLNYARAAHTATLLNDGRVLILGGSIAPYRTSRKATIFEQFDKVEVYLPNEKKFKVINELNDNRVAHTATLLKDGNVLIAGGTASTGEKIYDVKNNKFINVGNLNTKRYGHSAILLDDGNVLIAGGITNGVGPVNEIEIYNPNTKKFKVVNKIDFKQDAMSVTLKSINLNKLTDGRILITPVLNQPAIQWHKANPVYMHSFIYNYKINSLTTLPNFGDTCHYNITFVAKDSNIYNICSESYGSTIIEKYDLKNHSNIVLANLKRPRYDFSAVLTKDNSILIFGGRIGILGGLESVPSIEKYNIVKNKVSMLTNNWIYRKCFTVTELDNGKILLTGGSTSQDDRLKLAEEY